MVFVAAHFSAPSVARRSPISAENRRYHGVEPIVPNCAVHSRPAIENFKFSMSRRSSGELFGNFRLRAWLASPANFRSPRRKKFLRPSAPESYRLRPMPTLHAKPSPLEINFEKTAILVVDMQIAF